MSQAGVRSSSQGDGEGDERATAHPAHRVADYAMLNYYRTPHEGDTQQYGTHVNATEADPPSPPSPEYLDLVSPVRHAATASGNSSRLITPTSGSVPQFTLVCRRQNSGSGPPTTLRPSPTSAGVHTNNDAAGAAFTVVTPTASESVKSNSSHGGRLESRGSSQSALPRFVSRGHRAGSSRAVVHHHRQRRSQHTHHRRRAEADGSSSRQGSVGACLASSAQSAVNSGRSTPMLYGSDGIFAAGGGRHSAAAVAAAGAGHHGHFPQYAPVCINASLNTYTPTTAAECGTTTTTVEIQPRPQHQLHGNPVGIAAGAQARHWGAVQPPQQQQTSSCSQQARLHRHPRVGGESAESSRSGTRSRGSNEDSKTAPIVQGALFTAEALATSSPIRGHHSNSSTTVSSPATANGMPPRPTPTSATSHNDTRHSFPSSNSRAAAAPTTSSQTPTQGNINFAPFTAASRAAAAAAFAGSGGSEKETGVPAMAANRRLSNSGSTFTDQSNSPTTMSTPPVATPTTEFERSLACSIHPMCGLGDDHSKGAMLARRATSIAVTGSTYGEPQYPIVKNNTVGEVSYDDGRYTEQGESLQRDEYLTVQEGEMSISTSSPMSPPNPNAATPQPIPAATSVAPTTASPSPQQQQQLHYGLPQSHMQGTAHAFGAPRTFAAATTANNATAENAGNIDYLQQPPPPAPTTVGATRSHVDAGDHLSPATAGDFLRVSAFGSGEESSLYSLKHSASNSLSDSPKYWEEPVGVMDRAYTGTEAQMTLFQQRVGDALMQDALRSLGVGNTAAHTAGEGFAKPLPQGGGSRTSAGAATAGLPPPPPPPDAYASPSTTDPAPQHVSSNTYPHFSTQTGGLSRQNKRASAEPLINWSEAYTHEHPNITHEAAAAANSGTTDHHACPPQSNYNNHDDGVGVPRSSTTTTTTRLTSTLNDTQQQERLPSSSNTASGFPGQSIFRSATAPSMVTAIALGAESQSPQRGGSTGQRTTPMPHSPPTSGSNAGAFVSSPPAQLPISSPNTIMSTTTATCTAASAQANASNFEMSMRRRATSVGGWQGALNNSVLFCLNGSFNASAMLDPLAASVVMQQNRTALVAELKRRRQRLQKQLAQLQKEATARNIFALIRASNAAQVQSLLQEGLCSVNDRDYNGCTPLHVAAGEGNQAIVRVLLSFNADVLAVDHNGRTPLDCAAANRHSGVGRYLLTVIRNKHLAQEGSADVAGGVRGARADSLLDLGGSGALPIASSLPMSSPNTGDGLAYTTAMTTAKNSNATTTSTPATTGGGGPCRYGSGWAGMPDLLGGSFAVWLQTSPGPHGQHRYPLPLPPQAQQQQTLSSPRNRSPGISSASTPPNMSTSSLIGTSVALPFSAQPQQQDQQRSPSRVVDADGRNAYFLPTLFSATDTSAAASPIAVSPVHLSQSLTSGTTTSPQWRRHSTPHGSLPMHPVVLSALHSSAAARSRVLIAAESLSGTTVSPSSVANSPRHTVSTSSTNNDTVERTPGMPPMLSPAAVKTRATTARVNNSNANNYHSNNTVGSRPTSPVSGSMQSHSQTTLRASQRGHSAGAVVRSSRMVKPPPAGASTAVSDTELSSSTPPTLHDRPIVSAPPYLAGGLYTPLSEVTHDTNDEASLASLSQPHHPHEDEEGEGSRAEASKCLGTSTPSAFDIVLHDTLPPISILPESSLETEMDGKAARARPPQNNFFEVLNEDEQQGVLLGRREAIVRQRLAGTTADAADGGSCATTTAITRGDDSSHRYSATEARASTRAQSGAGDAEGLDDDAATAALIEEQQQQQHEEEQQKAADRASPPLAFSATAADYIPTKDVAASAATLGIAPGTRMLRPLCAFPVDVRDRRNRVTAEMSGLESQADFKSTEDNTFLASAFVSDTASAAEGSHRGVGSYPFFRPSQRESLSVCDLGEQSFEEHQQHFRLTAMSSVGQLRRRGPVLSPLPGTGAPLLQGGRTAAPAAATTTVNKKSSEIIVEGDGAEVAPQTTPGDDVFVPVEQAVPVSAAAKNASSQTDGTATASAGPVMPSVLAASKGNVLPQTASQAATAAVADRSSELSSTQINSALHAQQPKHNGRQTEEQLFLEQAIDEPLNLATLHHSSYTTVCDTVSLIVCMVGLPGRGKSFIGKRLVRYMNWKGVPCRVFNAGDYRRQLLGVEGTANAAFFDPSNSQGSQLREKMVELACEDLVNFISSHTLAVGILDATNTTRKRRTWLSEYFQQEAGKRGVPYRLLFIESVCTDDTIITENILRSKCDNDDFKNVKDVGAIIAEFRSRIVQYTKVYETCEPVERMPYIKIINVKHHVILHHVPNGLGSRIAFFLLNLHPIAFPIYIALPGETIGDTKHAYAGEERLTARGEAYAVALKNFIQERYVPHMVVLHATNFSVLSTLAPLMDGATEGEAAPILQVPTGSGNSNTNGTANTAIDASGNTGAVGAGPHLPKTGVAMIPTQTSKRAPPPPSIFTPATVGRDNTTLNAAPNSSVSVSVVVTTPTGDVAASLAAAGNAGAHSLPPSQHDAPTSPSALVPVSKNSSSTLSPAVATNPLLHRSEGEVTHLSSPSSSSSGPHTQHHHRRSRSGSCRATLANTEISVSERHPYSPTTTIEELRAMAGVDLTAAPLPAFEALASAEIDGRTRTAAATSDVRSVNTVSSTGSRTRPENDGVADTEGSAVATRRHTDGDGAVESESSMSEDSSESGEMCDEVLCPVPGLDNINYGRFSGHTAAWVKERYPRLSAMLYNVTEDYPTAPTAETATATAMKTNSGATQNRCTEARAGSAAMLSSPSAASTAAARVTAKADASPGALRINSNEWLSAPLPPPMHYATHEEAVVHLQHAPTGADPRLSYCIQFPNGESCRQVNVRLEPALMAVMRTQSPVFVVAPPVPAQGMLAFFMDVIPELSPTLRIPSGCVVEIGVKNTITVHPLLPDSLPASMTRSPLTVPPELQDAIGQATSPDKTNTEKQQQLSATAPPRSEPPSAPLTTTAGTATQVCQQKQEQEHGGNESARVNAA